MKRLLSAFLIFGVALAPQAHAVHYSKLGIVTAAKAAGKWEAVKSWIAVNGYTDEWQAAAYFSDAYPLFAAITNQVVASGLATRAEVDAFLAAAKDTAPDALLPGAYARDMQSAAGRQRWHGSFTSRFETNITERTIKRVDTYEDGYVYIEPGRGRRYLTPEEEAERAARRKTRTLDDRIAALKEHIANLEAATHPASTNESDLVSAARAVIELAAKRKTLWRLEAAKTNVVTVITQP